MSQRSRSASCAPRKRCAKPRIPFELPSADKLAACSNRFSEVIYLVFNEGYVATAGDAWTRPELCHEALRLGRILAELATEEPEVHGLVALMEFQTSTAARTPWAKR